MYLPKFHIYKTMYLDGLFLKSFCLCHVLVEATKGLIIELDAQFPEQAIMDAMGIIYP
jgi:hypothetical protein